MTDRSVPRARAAAVRRVAPVALATAGLGATAAVTLLPPAQVSVPTLPAVAVVVLVLCSALHYVAAAGALRSVSRARLPFGATTAATLAAGAANKVAPAGLGGSAVLARYLTRRAGLTASEALGCVGLVAAGRAVAATLTLVLLAGAGPWIGVDGGRDAVTGLAARLTHAGTPSGPALPWIATGTVVAVLVAALVVHRGRPRGLLAPWRSVARCPARVGGLLGCSAAQSVVLGLAFAVATLVLPGAHPAASPAALVAGYLMASAVASAVPSPGGVGSVEAGLTAVLVAADVPMGHALADVLVFRAVTVWAPAGVGVLCAIGLRRRGVL